MLGTATLEWCKRGMVGITGSSDITHSLPLPTIDTTSTTTDATDASDACALNYILLE